MSDNTSFLRGTFILTLTGVLSRVIGFFYRIFLTHTIGAEEIGIYQLLFPFYSLCFAFCVSGIQTALSRLIASRLTSKNRKEAFDLLCTGTAFSLLLSLITAFFVYRFAPFWAVRFLKEPRTAPLLRLLSLSIPLGTLHTCVCAYYFACRKTAIPSAAQLLEQSVRIAASWIVYTVCISEGKTPTASLAVAGILIGECASAIFSLLALAGEFYKHHYRTTMLTHPFSNSVLIFRQSLPLTANRLSLSLLRSVEAVLIPSHLVLYGLSVSESLSTYGILSGMALPLIFFPSAVTTSVSTLLLPTIAGEQAAKHQEKISLIIQRTLQYCLQMGIFIGVFFFTYGQNIGFLLFSNTDVGVFLKTLAFLCPFLYLNGTLASILNGLGKATACFLQNLTGTCIRLAFTVFAVPVFGITGYLWGLLCSELVITALSILNLRRISHFEVPAFRFLVLPFISAVLSLGGMRFFLPLFTSWHLQKIVSFLLAAVITLFFYIIFLLALHLLKLSPGEN